MKHFCWKPEVNAGFRQECRKSWSFDHKMMQIDINRASCQTPKMHHWEQPVELQNRVVITFWGCLSQLEMIIKSLVLIQGSLYILKCQNHITVGNKATVPLSYKNLTGLKIVDIFWFVLILDYSCLIFDLVYTPHKTLIHWQRV